MAKQEEIINTIKVLRQEVEVLTTRLKPAGTGHLHTAIGVINKRIDELIGEAITPYFDNPDNNLSPRKLASEIYGEDVYDGYEEHIKADDMSGDYEHTKEYYDRNRNRAMEGEDFHLEPLPINTFK